MNPTIFHIGHASLTESSYKVASSHLHLLQADFIEWFGINDAKARSQVAISVNEKLVALLLIPENGRISSRYIVVLTIF